MKAKKLRKLLKKVPPDVEVKILAYGYSQGRMEKFEIDRIMHDYANWEVVLRILD